MADRNIRSVKAVISSYEGSPAKKKIQPNIPEKSYTKTGELHQAKRDTSQFYESRKLAESATEEAEAKLAAAKKTVKDLTAKIEESDSRVKAHMMEMDLEKVKMSKGKEDEGNSEDYEFAKVFKELETIKRDLSKLKMDMASLMEERRKADKETESSMLKTESASSLISTLTKKVEEVDEEHVLVELARIEAVKEYKEIEAQKKEEDGKHLALMEETERKKQRMIREIEQAKQLEKKLAITISDISMLESELKQIKEIRSDFTVGMKSESASLVMRELEDAKKELEAVKDEGFQFMASMDVVRNELRHIMEETARLKTKEGKAEIVVQNMSSKLLRAKSKLEATSAAEDRAKLLASNLTSTLEHIQSEIETAKTERALINEETATINAEIQKADTEIGLAEERLQAAVQDLKAVKASEAIALDKLKEIIENTIRNRASASQRSPTITISKFEYEYLKGHAQEAKEIADKKVAAAQAWVDALKASEREILIKTEQLRRESRELKVEKHGVHKTEPLAEEAENDTVSWTQMQPDNTPLGKATNKSFKITPARRLKSRKSASPVIRLTPTRSTSTTTRRRKKVISNLSQIFSGKGKNQ